MASKSKSAPVTVLPTLPGQAYAAEVIAPVITEWLQAAGVATNGVDGMDVRNVVRGKRKGIASPVPRLKVRPAMGNRTHMYTVEEAAAIFATFGRIAGLPDLTLPAPFKGHGTGTTVKRAPRKAVAKVTLQASKAEQAPANVPTKVTDAS